MAKIEKNRLEALKKRQEYLKQHSTVSEPLGLQPQPVTPLHGIHHTTHDDMVDPEQKKLEQMFSAKEQYRRHQRVQQSSNNTHSNTHCAHSESSEFSSWLLKPRAGGLKLDSVNSPRKPSPPKPAASLSRSDSSCSSGNEGKPLAPLDRPLKTLTTKLALTPPKTEQGIWTPKKSPHPVDAQDNTDGIFGCPPCKKKRLSPNKPEYDRKETPYKHILATESQESWQQFLNSLESAEMASICLSFSPDDTSFRKVDTVPFLKKQG